jgi:acyl-CoA thioesterase FadM
MELAAIAAAAQRMLPVFAVALFCVEFVRMIPGAYHVRCLAVYLYEIYWRRARGRIGAIDAPVVASGQRVLLGDLDFNLHMNNAVYALIADHARFHWYVLWFSNAGTPAAFERIHIAVGHVSTIFYKEMRWLQRFRTETRCVGFDAKWCFVEVRFVSEGGRAPATLHAVTLARICFKEKQRGAAKGRTIPPAEALAMLGFAVPPELAKSPGCEAGALLVRTSALLQQQAKAE